MMDVQQLSNELNKYGSFNYRVNGNGCYNASIQLHNSSNNLAVFAHNSLNKALSELLEFTISFIKHENNSSPLKVIDGGAS